MATVPTGYVFWDVSANKKYTAGQTMPALGNGDYLTPATTSNDGYYQQYDYYTSHSNGDVSYTNGWYGYVLSQYKNQTQSSPFNEIGGKPVRAFSYYMCTFSSSPQVSNRTNLYWLSYMKCANLTTAPVLPSGLKSINYIFYKTKVKTADFSKTPNVEHAYYAFGYNTSITSPPNISVMTKLKDARKMFEGCTSLTSAPTLPNSVVDAGWMFYGCTALTTGTTITPNVTSVWQMFYGCTNLSGVILVQSDNINSYTKCFYNTSAAKQIILLQALHSVTYQTISKLASTTNNKNVYAGVVAEATGFTAIRGDYENGAFTEHVSGDYCKLEFSYTAPYLPSAKILIPYLSKTVDGVVTDIKNNVTWHVNALSGSSVTDDGINFEDAAIEKTETSGRKYYYGKMISVYQVGSDSASFDMRATSKYTYNGDDYGYSNGTRRASLTLSNTIIDVNTSGNGIAFGDECPENLSGMFIARPLYLSLDINASSGTVDGDLYAQIHNLEWDSSVID